MKGIYIIVFVLSVLSCKKATQCVNSDFIPREVNTLNSISKKGKVKVITKDCSRYDFIVNGETIYQDSTDNIEKIFSLNESDTYQVNTTCDTATNPIEIYQRFTECD